MNRIDLLEQQLVGEKERLAKRDAILRLSKNADFRKIITEGFFIEDCARYVRESINPVLEPREQAMALAMAQAAGYLKQFLNISIQMGDVAAGTISELDVAIQEERAQPLEMGKDQD